MESNILRTNNIILTRIEADDTSLLGVKAPTELCCKKSRYVYYRQVFRISVEEGDNQGSEVGGDDSSWDGNTEQC